MKPIEQTEIGSKRGDCVRAVMASLFELEIVQVPHFLLFKERFDHVFKSFISMMGYEWVRNADPKEDKLIESDSVDGFFDACVPSANHKGKFHAVVIDMNGVVVHDPQPEKAYQDKNVLESGDLRWWTVMKKTNDRVE